MSETAAKPFRIAFIGAGGIALHHMRTLKKIPGAEVIAIADISQKALNAAKEEFGVPWVFTDYKQMLQDLPEIEAVDICTPNGLHAQNTIDSLNAGKHVMVEKPMAMNVREAREMVAASERNGKKLIVGFQHRFEARSKLLRERIASGEFGKILFVRAQALRRRGIPSWGVFGRKDLQGGGPMIDIGVHILEASHAIIGGPKPVSATANIFTYIGNQPPVAAAQWGPWDYSTYTVEDLAVGMIRFENGTMLSIETSFAAHIEEDEWNITILGEKAGASWKSSKIFKDEGGYMVNSQATYLGAWDHFEYKMRHFVEVCRDDRPNEVTAEQALMVQQMLDAIYASAEQGKEVTIE